LRLYIAAGAVFPSFGARLSEFSMETPCIGVCHIDLATGLCDGCRRSRHEIAMWARITPAERRKLMDELKARDPGTAAASPRA
jgi:predicted Fe-S protein YdhL (DUF1289 family)